MLQVGPDENRLPQTGCTESAPATWMMAVGSRFSDSLTIVVARPSRLWLGWRESQAEDLASPGDAAIMPTQSESPAAVSGTSSKTLQLLRKRLRQLLRVMLVLTIGLAVAAAALAIWWLNSLNGLPDIGDPFDVAAFRAFRIPDDQNAFTFLRRAKEKLTPSACTISRLSWSEADPKFREWVEANRPAVELFQQGAEQVRRVASPDGEFRR